MAKKQEPVRISRAKIHDFSGDLVVFCAVERDKKAPLCDSRLKKIVYPAWKAGDFKGKENDFFLVYPSLLVKTEFARLEASRLAVIGLGSEKEDADEIREQLRIAGGHIATRARGCGAQKVLIVLPDIGGLSTAAKTEALVEGLVLGNYSFDKYKTKQEEGQGAPVHVFSLAGCGSTAAMRRGLRQGLAVAMAACRARDMANEPGNVWTPEKFAQFGRKLSRKYPLKCRVMGKATMEKLGMGGILAVNQGSARPAKLVVLEYRSSKKNPTLLLVGKGLTFDSGGVSLKPAAGMEDMKYDMCGGAAVMAVMEVIGQEEPDHVNVIALVPTTENMGGASALKPGDIITHYGGKTSEVVNTDAEGRLILADALAWGIDIYKPDAVVDLATLTGAVIIGLGHHRTGLLSTSDQLVSQIEKAGSRTAEPFWRLPLGPEYAKQLKSKVADLKNVGGRPAGTITAAAYLQEFVGDTPWAHWDIAGTAWDFTEKSYVPKGPSGIGVRSLAALVRAWKPFAKTSKK